MTPLKNQFLRVHCSLAFLFNLPVKPPIKLFELEIIEFVMLASICFIRSSQAKRVLEKVVDIGELSKE